ncbi:MAG: hypothetical protein ACI9DC_002334 [Gammaproteobacteria bacterium]|jgi:hypothetical protein
MSRADSTPAEQPVRYNKVRDRALVLPLLGILLLVSPLAGISQLDAKPFGVPFTLIYLFTVWAVLIAGAYALARRLRDGDAASSSSDSLDLTTAAADEADADRHVAGKR